MGTHEWLRLSLEVGSHRTRAVSHLGRSATLAGLTILVVFFTMGASRESVHPTADWFLSAHRISAKEIELQWNVQDLRMLPPDEAILSIIDGGKEHNEYLSADDIRQGTYRYQRESWDVWFCLRLFHDGRRIYVDEIRLLDSEMDNSPSPPKPGHQYIQVAAVLEADAEQLAHRLTAQGLPVAYERAPRTDNLYRVLVGPVDDGSQLPRMRAEIGKTGLVEVVPFVRRF